LKKEPITEYQAKTAAYHLAAEACEELSRIKYLSKSRILINYALHGIAQDLEKKARERENLQDS